MLYRIDHWSHCIVAKLSFLLLKNRNMSRPRNLSLSPPIKTDLLVTGKKIGQVVDDIKRFWGKFRNWKKLFLAALGVYVSINARQSLFLCKTVHCILNSPFLLFQLRQNLDFRCFIILTTSQWMALMPFHFNISMTSCWNKKKPNPNIWTTFVFCNKKFPKKSPNLVTLPTAYLPRYVGRYIAPEDFVHVR